jgi:hypothetical protein
MTAGEALAAVEGSDLAQWVVKKEISEQMPTFTSQNHPEANKLFTLWALLSATTQQTGKADDTASSVLPRVYGSLLQLHPWMPCCSEAEIPPPGKLQHPRLLQHQGKMSQIKKKIKVTRGFQNGKPI